MIKVKEKEKPNYQMFPPCYKDKNIKIWKNLYIDQKGKININENEKIYESRIYPYKYETGKLKVISKINTENKKITFIINSGRIQTGQIVATKKKYQNYIKDLETDLQNTLNIEKKQVIKGTYINELIKKEIQQANR